ncbi:MAG: alpha amylase C-terminal domain-containing protein [Akkermansiaceae bacterium]|nr:alpha amylase C-terminal domain-containing protein [Armatimonadota bacterium]
MNDDLASIAGGVGLSEPPGLVQVDPWLAPHAEAIRQRIRRVRETLGSFGQTGGLTGEISIGHRYFGFTRGESHGEGGVWYREWAPGAQSLRLIGDFNNWNRDTHPLARDEFGVWHLFLPDALYSERLGHGARVKVHVVGADGSRRDRVPAYALRVVSDPKTHDYSAQVWLPESAGQGYAFRNPLPTLPEGEGLRVYEAHVGMAQEAGKVGSYDEFRENILPRIVKLGYNAVQLMAIQEHPYYASFGYHVSSFFAVSSRFGTPEELKRLVDEAHRHGVLMLLDLVHSHAVKNINEGLNRFDGSDSHYFHPGERGQHPAWDSLLFDYGKYEVRRFLLSNVRYWLEEFRFDGFRFDGVTSMLYHDHGLERAFSSYGDYFPPNTEEDAVLYLQLANVLAHTVHPGAITIAEDVSGMAGIARPVAEGGVGFDYRLAMGVPDFWIKLVQDRRDEDWNITEIYRTLVNRRWSEKHVGYAESHDQALVGDKTLAFRLMDQEMYWSMGKESTSLVVDRGIALLKLIRLVTFTLSGEGYLNFMGNEFGHPEWVDFPREGNEESFQHARRQWSLADRDDLRYGELEVFDAALQTLDKRHHLLADPLVEELSINEGDKVLVYRRGPLVFAVNFHPAASYTAYRIPVPDPQDYALILDTDSGSFGGHARIEPGTRFARHSEPFGGRAQSVYLYLPSRTAVVLAPVETEP